MAEINGIDFDTTFRNLEALTNRAAALAAEAEAIRQGLVQAQTEVYKMFLNEKGEYHGILESANL